MSNWEISSHGGLSNNTPGAETCGLLTERGKALRTINPSTKGPHKEWSSCHISLAFVFFCSPRHFLCLEHDSFWFYCSDFLFPRCFCLKLSQQVGSPAADRQSHYLPLLEICISVHWQVKQNVEEGIFYFLQKTSAPLKNEFNSLSILLNALSFCDIMPLKRAGSIQIWFSKR